MSLQVWLPLNGDLTQQGLSNINVINNGATVSDTGKIGKCYSFGTGASSLSLPTSTFTSLSGDFSVACWIKILSWNTSYTTFWSATSTSASWANVIAALIRNGTSSKLIFCLGNDSTSITSTCSTVDDIQLNTWYHFTCVYKTGKAYLYQNGILVKSVDVSFTPKTSAVQVVNIGKSRENTYQSNCLMNDFRIYNHALSQQEVKQLAQGLVVHYPLDNNGFGNENLFLNSSLTDLTSENLGTKIRYANPYIPIITDDGIKFTWSGSSAREIDLYLGDSLDPNTYYTLSFIYRNNMDIGSSFYLRNGNTLVGYFSQKTISYSENWTKYTYTFKPVSYQENDITTGDSLTLFYSGYTENKWIEIKQNSIKLEKGSVATPWCPNPEDSLASVLDMNDGVEYDVSGFKYNGNRIGTFSWSSDSPRYISDMKFSTTSSKIKLPEITYSNFGNSYTFSWWQYNTGTGNMPWGFSNGNRLNVYHTSTLCWNTGDGSSNPFKDGSTTIASSSLQNAWHHIAVTGDGTSSKIYIDGVYRGSATTYKALTGTQIYLSGWDTGTSYTFNGSNLSDFRIYATALSADDIKSLYEDSAYIDTNGIIYPYTLNESMSSDIDLSKQGVLTADSFTETSTVEDPAFKSNKEVTANGFYEL